MESIELIETNRDESLCRICGYDFGSPVRLASGQHDSDICPCCRAEVACDDEWLGSIRRYRQKWLDEGGTWKHPGRPAPPNWDREAQMKNIPPEFL